MIATQEKRPAAQQRERAETNSTPPLYTTTDTLPNYRTKPVDAVEVERALRLLLPPGQITELRVLKGTLRGERYQTTLSGYFNNADNLIAELKNVASAQGIYIIPNPVEPALLARANNRLKKADKGDTTTDSAIVRRHWFLIDCDPVRPSGISATNAEHKATIQRAADIAAYLSDAGWYEAIKADSGNGAHLLYRIDLPVEDGGIVQRCLAALAAQFDDGAVKVDKGVFNPARIWKLYGTLACKGDSTAERPHRMSKILSVPDSIQVVGWEQLEQLAATVPIQPAQKKRESSDGQATDIETFIARHNLDVAGPTEKPYGRVWTFCTSPVCDHHDQAAFLIQFNNGAVAAKCHHNSCSWTWHDLRAQYEPNAKKASKSEGPRSPVRVCLADIHPEDIEWLWPGRIAVGKVTLIQGDPGLGKSLVTLDLAARVSRGAEWPDKTGIAQQAGSVILLSAEDDAADTLRPRLDAAEAVCGRIHQLKAIKGQSDEGDYVRGFDLSRDIEQLRQVIDDTPDCRLVIIDPISAYLGKADSHVNADVRAVLSPLAELAAENRVAIVVVSHLRKGDGAAIHRGMGSIGFLAAARAAWVVVKDKNDPSRRLMLAVKNNLADDGTSTGLAYTVESDGPKSAPYVCWEAEPVTISADEALASEPKKRGRPPEQIEIAKEFLLGALKNGSRPVKELQKEADEGHCISKETLKRAKRELGVVSFRKEPDIHAPWFWRLDD